MSKFAGVAVTAPLQPVTPCCFLHRLWRNVGKDQLVTATAGNSTKKAL